MKLSVIIPVLNEREHLPATLAALESTNMAHEVLVVDGGSTDGTQEWLCEQSFARVVHAQRGRGMQLDAGARAAHGDVLWFLHADTRPPIDAAAQIFETLRREEVVGGNFGVRFDGARRAARFLTWLYPHLRKLGLCYGDSALFVRRSAYEMIGGFRSFPIFEDLDFLRRLKQAGRFVRVSSSVTTSSRRFEGRSFALTFVHWTVLQALYWLGVHPRTLNRFYAPIRTTARPKN